MSAPTDHAPTFRTAERLQALYRYEIERRGTAAMLEELLDLVHDTVLDDEDCERIARQCTAVGEAILRTLTALGYGPEVESFIESSARSRAACDARFATTREVPFTETEKTELAAEWDAAKLAADAIRGAS